MSAARATHRPFTALSRDRDRSAIAAPPPRTPGTPASSVSLAAEPPSSYQESPTAARLQMLHSRLSSSSTQDRERRAVREKEKESKLVLLDDKLSVLLASQEADRKRTETDDQANSRQLSERVEALSKSLAQLQHDFVAEEQTRKTLNSTFAKNFAIKIEERFIKMEALVSSQKRQLAEAEEARVRMMQQFDSKLSEMASRFEQERAARLQRQDEDNENWKRVQAAIDRIETVIEHNSKASAEREESLWGRVSQEVNQLRGDMDGDRAQRERDEDEKMRLINEGIAFIKDGKETWLRMFDYKMMPFKVQREEDEARAAKMAKEVEGKLGELYNKLDLLEGNVEEERRVREEEITSVVDELRKESRQREGTEEQISRLLETTINRLDDLAHS